MCRPCELFMRCIFAVTELSLFLMEFETAISEYVTFLFLGVWNSCDW